MGENLTLSALGVGYLEKRMLSRDRLVSVGHEQIDVNLIWYKVGPPTIAKLVNITPITIVYGTYKYIFWCL